MLALNNDLFEGYEIISPDAFLSKGACLKDCCDTKKRDTPVRDFIKPVENSIKKENRLMKVAKSPAEVSDFVLNALAILGYSHLKVDEQLQAIAYMIMQRFNKKELKCHMNLLYSNKCKSFNMDKFFVRSITTLNGPGAELKLKETGNEIYKIDTGDTLLIKGSHYPGGNDKAFYQSPKISHLGISRLLFVMDC
jgi:hypothetical protein